MNRTGLVTRLWVAPIQNSFQSGDLWNFFTLAGKYWDALVAKKWLQSTSTRELPGLELSRMKLSHKSGIYDGESNTWWAFRCNDLVFGTPPFPGPLGRLASTLASEISTFPLNSWKYHSKNNGVKKSSTPSLETPGNAAGVEGEGFLFKKNEWW